MEDRSKNREELLGEVAKLRARNSRLSTLTAKYRERERDMKTTERRFQALFERHNAIMLLIEPDSGKIVDANRAACRFYGYGRDELFSMNISDINQLEPAQITKERKLAKNERRNYFVFPHRLADGEIRTVEVHSTPLETQGQLLLLSIIHDITDRRKAEEELERYRERLEALVGERTAELETKNELLTQEVAEREAAERSLQASERQQKQLAYELGVIIDSFPGLIFYKGLQNNFLRVNRHLAEAHSMSKDRLEGRTCFDLYPPEKAQRYWDDDLEVIKSGRAKLNIEEPWDTQEGTRWVLTCKVPFIDGSGNTIGVIGISQDITERKRAEQERERLLVELRDALAKVKTLSGLLPICSYCKKIKNDKGHWEQMETYIRDRSDADFSHGLCPDCARDLFPEYFPATDEGLPGS